VGKVQKGDENEMGDRSYSRIAVQGKEEERAI